MGEHKVIDTLVFALVLLIVVFMLYIFITDSDLWALFGVVTSSFALAEWYQVVLKPQYGKKRGRRWRDS